MEILNSNILEFKWWCKLGPHSKKQPKNQHKKTATQTNRVQTVFDVFDVKINVVWLILILGSFCTLRQINRSSSHEYELKPSTLPVIILVAYRYCREIDFFVVNNFYANIGFVLEKYRNSLYYLSNKAGEGCYDDRKPNNPERVVWMLDLRQNSQQRSNTTGNYKPTIKLTQGLYFQLQTTYIVRGKVISVILFKGGVSLPWTTSHLIHPLARNCICSLQQKMTRDHDLLVAYPPDLLLFFFKPSNPKAAVEDISDSVDCSVLYELIPSDRVILCLVLILFLRLWNRFLPNFLGFVLLHYAWFCKKIKTIKISDFFPSDGKLG